MRNLYTLSLVASLVLASFPIQAQEPDPIVTWQTLINEARLDEGLDPFDLSDQLTASAQRHADDMVANQISSSVGSDGSMPKQRIAEARYAAWTQENGELIAGENFWIGDGTIEDAMVFFLEDPPQRANILSTAYREIGIGAATGADGRNYYVLDFGVRPNVLPIFINDGATNTDNPQVAIRLTNENVRSEGEGANYMGRAIEIRISNDPNLLDDSPWQPWEPLVPWTLPDTQGEHIVYVQFRDAAGRTAGKTDRIVLGEGVLSAPTAIPPIPTLGPTATPIPTFPPSESAAAPTPAATSAPESPPVAVSPTPYVVSAAPGDQGGMPFPTWTPLPTPTPQKDDVPSSLPPWLATLERLALPLLVAMQGVVIILGVYLILRRGSSQT